ncbi:MAG TPA: cytochrome b/b6 domain-containing protein [Gammaproteobacteria bacterium]|nr:cytochrome b/b6 domain-containing protein [Gammaproteobacteria bacterium]
MSIEVAAATTFWDRKTKLLHLGLALFVTFELFNSLVMQEPESTAAQQGFGGIMFEIHEWTGMVALAIVLLHWLWSLWGASEAGVRHLFPWGSAGRSQIGRELRELASLRLPPGGPENRLAGLVHGLGFLAVTGMVLTGVVLFFGIPEGGAELTGATQASEEIHEALSTLVWVYWGGHLAMAVLHELLARDGTLHRMFKLASV